MLIKTVFKKVIFFGGLLSLGVAQASFFSQKAEGWHWYQDPIMVLEKSEAPIQASSPAFSPIFKTASEVVKAYQQELQKRLHLAWVIPTEQNVKAYQVMQKDLVQRSHEFSQTWMRVVYQNPDFDHSVAFPSSHLGRHLYLDQKKALVKETIRALAQDYGLFFFFSSGCAYCHQFAPIVQQFSKEHGWHVLAVSSDGGTLPGFKDALPDNGLIEQWKVQVLPALFAVNPKTAHIVPLAYGLTTIDQIEDRLMTLLQKPQPGGPS